MAEVGPLLEAVPYLGSERWVGLASSMRTVNGRLRIEPGRISLALVRAEAGALRRTYTANPENRALIGFVVGWFALLVSLLGTLEIVSRPWRIDHLVPLILHVYLLGCSVVTCVLELEINSALVRDHVALPIERSLAFLQLASGRGVFYCATGLLAVDTVERAQMMCAAAMLSCGAFNLILGSVVALKLRVA